MKIVDKPPSRDVAEPRALILVLCGVQGSPSEDLGADDSIGAANATLALLLTRRQKCPANGEDEASVSSLSFVLPQMYAKRMPDSHSHTQLTCSFRPGRCLEMRLAL